MLALLYLASYLAVGALADPQTDGLKALDREDYTQAEQIFSKLTVADPKDFASFFNLSLAEIGLKKDDEAAADLKQVLVLKPGLYEAELNLGILDLRRHDAVEALPLLRDAANQKPKLARPQRYLGDALLATGDFATAADAYKAALAINPKLASAELGLAQSLLRQNNLEEALGHYQQAARLDQNLQSYLLEIASAFLNSNQPDKAIELFRQFPDDPGAREQLGRLYLAANRPADAVAEFEAAVKLSPTPANRLALATAYIKNKQNDAAAPLLEQAVAVNPNDYDLRMTVGRIHRDKREFVPAANEFLTAAKIKPDSVEAWNEAASVLVLAEQYQQALAALDQVHNLNADTAGDFYYRAMVLDKMHQVKPALASYQRFLAMSEGKFPDQEFVARQRSRILEKEANR